MTVINGIEIDDIDYKINDIKYAIANNDPIEEKLNVIIVISNPCLYARRYILLKEFVKRMEEEETHVNLYVVEMIYSSTVTSTEQRFLVTDKKNKNHLQLTVDVPLWHKENMVNLAVKYLLPENYRAFAWIDADIEFESSTWAMDTLKILNGCKDIVQLFSHCVDMDREKGTLNIFNSFGYCYGKNKKYTSRGIDYWHPGYAWAITRKAYEKMGGLYDKGVLGSCYNIMAMAIINQCVHMMHDQYHPDYNHSMYECQEKMKRLRLGYVPGVVRHHYHGSKKNRKYRERWEVLIKHQYSPVAHVSYDVMGVLIPTAKFTDAFRYDILDYFVERKEDD
jgi:hypothetical protein